MHILKIAGASFLIAALCLGSCSKTGPAGPQGQQGEQGAQGIPGADGSTIYSGNGSPAADVGKAGDYYLDKSNGNLYGPKTDQGWGGPLSLKGQNGDQGDPGQNGQDGSRILSGTSAPEASAGNTGDYYWNTSNFTRYGPKTSSGWGAGVLLRGPKGDKGDTGTANVMYSAWMNFNWNFKNGSLDKVMLIAEPKITQDFYDKGGALLGYEKVRHYDSDPISGQQHTILTEVLELPIYKPAFGLTCEGAYGTDYPDLNPPGGNHYIVVELFSEDQSDLTDGLQDGNGDDYDFRYILIPGGIQLRKSSPPPDPKDYKATCAYYGIPE